MYRQPTTTDLSASARLATRYRHGRMPEIIDPTTTVPAVQGLPAAILCGTPLKCATSPLSPDTTERVTRSLYAPRPHRPVLVDNVWDNFAAPGPIAVESNDAWWVGELAAAAIVASNHAER